MNKQTSTYCFLVIVSLLSLVGLTLSTAAHAQQKYRQPAYITNAYFSDKMIEEKGVLRPVAVVKALPTRSSGVVGYFILDLILTEQGTHHFKVNILDQTSKKITDLVYAPVELPKNGDLPLYTAAGAISGNFPPGIWFFKVYDQVERGGWNHLGTFGIMILDPKKK